MRIEVASGIFLLAAAGLFAASGWRMMEHNGSALVCPSQTRPMAKIELLFSAQRRNSVPVSDEEWEAFLAAEVTPRFPDGLTVLTGYGQWRDSAGRLIKETSRLLLIWYAPEAGDTRIEAIRTAYKARFGQESVLRADGAPACVSF